MCKYAHTLARARAHIREHTHNTQRDVVSGSLGVDGPLCEGVADPDPAEIDDNCALVAEYLLAQVGEVGLHKLNFSSSVSFITH